MYQFQTQSQPQAKRLYRVTDPLWDPGEVPTPQDPPCGIPSVLMATGPDVDLAGKSRRPKQRTIPLPAAALLALTTSLALACSATFPEPNVAILRLDPISLAHEAAKGSTPLGCSQDALRLADDLALLIPSPPEMCRPPHCSPVASNCETLTIWCSGKEALLDHGLSSPPQAFGTLCTLAQRCLELEQQERTTLSRLARIEFLYAVLASEANLALKRYLAQLRSHHPELLENVNRLATIYAERERLLCAAYPLYLEALARSAALLLEPHPKANEHIAREIQNLPATPGQFFTRMTPVTYAYQRLVDAHRLVRAAADGGGFLAVPSAILKASPGEKSQTVTALRTRLIQEGAFLGDPEGPLDHTVLSALAAYNAAHGLEQTQPISRKTLNLLEIPAARKARQLALALAAIRRAIPPWQATFVHVQSPHAFLEFYVDGRMVAYHRTVLGSARKDINEETKRRERLFMTPTLSSFITNIIVNPQWNVPESIATKEIAPKAESDPEFLERSRFRVLTLKDGKQRFIQDPGDGNALGRIKFHFNNGYGVYLHDTPAKKHFKKSYRLLSHGCVRVQHATQLALRMLSRDQNISENDLRLWLKSRRTREIPLITPVPVHITYHTAGADSSGQLYYSKDYYDLEK